MLKYDYHTKRRANPLDSSKFGEFNFAKQCVPHCTNCRKWDSCCGQYPSRFPYFSDDGKKQCCGQKECVSLLFMLYSELLFPMRVSEKLLVSIGNVPTVIRATTQVKTPIKDLLQICSTMLSRGSTPAIWHVWLWQLKKQNPIL